MRRPSDLLLLLATLVLTLFAASPAASQTPLVATSLFAAEDGGERNGLAYEPATQRLYTVSSADELRAYALDGTKLAGPIAITSGGSPVAGRDGETGIHFVGEDVTIGGTSVGAGSLVFIQAGAGNDPLNANETTLYAIDAATGAAFASEVVSTGILTPPAGCGNVLKDAAKGLGYSTSLNRFVTIDVPCEGFAAIEDGDVLGFTPVPGGILGTSGGAGVTVHPVTGNVWVGGAIQGLGTNVLSEFDDAGALLRSFAVVETGTGAPVSLRRLSFDPTGDRLFMLSFEAEVFELATPATTAVPSMNAVSGVGLLMALALVGSAAAVSRRSRDARA
jgi:hypothetical protein